MKTLLFVAWFGIHGADAGITHQALVSGRGREVVLTQQPWVNDALVMGTASGVWAVAAPQLDRHKKLTTVLLWTCIGIRTAVVVHNVRELR